MLDDITENFISSTHQKLLNKAMNDFYNNKLSSIVLKNDKKFMANFDLVCDYISKTKSYKLKAKDSYKTVILMRGTKQIHEWHFRKYFVFGEFEDVFLNEFINAYDNEHDHEKELRMKSTKITKSVNAICDKINDCKNKCWSVSVDYRKKLKIMLFNYQFVFDMDYSDIDDDIDDCIKTKITKIMNDCINRINDQYTRILVQEDK